MIKDNSYFPKGWRSPGLALLAVMAIVLIACGGGEGPAAGSDCDDLGLAPGDDRVRISTAAHEVVFSPDCRYVVMSESGDGLRVSSVDGKRTVQLTEKQPYFEELLKSWSPDSSRVAYVDPRDGLWVFRVDGEEPERLTSSDVASWAWSPDGELLAYDEDGELWVSRPDGEEAQRLVRTVGSWAWSPDGELLAYDEDGELWVSRPDGEEAQRLVRTVGSWAWSPDGELLCLR